MGKFKILIVEDAQLIAVHLQKILQNANYEVIGRAANYEEAIAICKKSTPDLALMDIMIDGDKDGIETAIELKEKYNLPIIYLTALTDGSTIERAKKTNPYGYIMKPFQEEQVVTFLEMAIHKYTVENKLRESEEKFKAAVGSISDALLFVEEDFTVSYLNKAAEAISGQSLTEVEGKPLVDVFKFSDFETGNEIPNIWKWFNVKDNEQEFKSLYLTQPNGKKVPIGDGTINAVFDEKKKLKGVVLTFKNITKRLENESMEKQLEKTKLAAIIEGQEMERARISREIHDGLGQTLNAIKLNISTFFNGADKERAIKDLQNLIGEAILETGRISENLLPSKLKDFDISTCLLSLSNQKYGDLSVSFESTEVKHDRIGINKKINLYRITQEAISNAAKHANAKNLNIQLRSSAKSVILTIEDDGVGFDVSTRNNKVLEGHHGLQNIEDRVNIMDGVFEIDSKNKLGTVLIIEVPYDKKLAVA
ncbi:response regulator [Fulvivirga lutea]|uniref:Response regulator n=1 Tax=Fulvivirga lutea TaxID=2810512 RepID=A0A975A0V2_9BACT|nr:response regulator [Fulvivirga lutea]QSE97585.1 response regulator [Fulvivirga lutea]